MRTETRLHLGSGGRNIGHGFTCFDEDIDVSKPLPWADNSVEFIVISHCIEHISPAEAFSFLREARRILKPGGVIRVTVPDVVQIWEDATPEYLNWLKSMGWGDGSKASAIENIVCRHGHKGLFCSSSIWVLMAAAGFSQVQHQNRGFSKCPELASSDHHHLQIGEAFDLIESCIVEGVK